jgi:hypothetical protein
MSGLFGDRVAPAVDERDAAWVGSRFDWDLVNCSGFERYVRIDHTAPGDTQRWDAPVELVAQIARTAAGHTSTPAEAQFAIWDGHGWPGTSVYWVNLDHRHSSNPLHRICGAVRERRFRRHDRRRQLQAHRDLERALAHVPRSELWSRAYYLLAGAVDAASGITAPGGQPLPQMPDLWWPKDRAWFVATDTDFDWTVVGGSERLASDLLQALPGQSQLVRTP